MFVISLTARALLAPLVDYLNAIRSWRQRRVTRTNHFGGPAIPRVSNAPCTPKLRSSVHEHM